MAEPLSPDERIAALLVSKAGLSVAETTALLHASNENAQEPLRSALSQLLAAMVEVEEVGAADEFVMPGCEHFLDEDGCCRVCTAMQDANCALEGIPLFEDVQPVQPRLWPEVTLIEGKDGYLPRPPDQCVLFVGKHEPTDARESDWWNKSR